MVCVKKPLLLVLLRLTFVTIFLMLKFIALIVVGLLVLSLSELIRKRVGVRNEYSRKTYHIVHAILISMAPFLVSYKIIIGLELLLFVEMLIIRKFKLLPWLYDVGRISWGDFFTVAGVVSVSLLKPDPWVFLAAMLHLGFADTLAALVGKRYGQSTSYKIFGQTKSLAGSLAFYVVSLFITLVALQFTPLQHHSLSIVLLLPPLVTLAENLSPFGSDNFIIPIVVVLIFQAI